MVELDKLVAFPSLQTNWPQINFRCAPDREKSLIQFSPRDEMGTDGAWPLFISTFLCWGNWFKSIFSILLPPDTICQPGSEQNITVHMFLFLSFSFLSFFNIIYLFFLAFLAFVFFSLSLRGIVPEGIVSVFQVCLFHYLMIADYHQMRDES